MRNLLNNWSVARSIRLIASIGIAAYAVFSKEYIFLILSIILLLQALLNLSCCGVANCNTQPQGKINEVYKGQIKEYKK